MSRFLADLRLAARSLARVPGFSLAAVLVLGLGLGAGATVFSAVDAVLFRPLPVPEPERLVRLFSCNEQHHGLSGTSYPVFKDYVEQARSFSGVAAFSSNVPVNLSWGGEMPQLARAAVVSGGYFPMLGIRPAAGRLLSPADDGAPGASPVAVLAEGAARTRFGSPEAALQATIRVNALTYTVVGVVPASYTGVDLESRPELFVPASMAEPMIPGLAGLGLLTSRAVGWVDLVARLAPGVTVAQAQAELDGIAARRAAAQPEAERDPWAYVVPASKALVAGDLGDGAAAGATSRLSWLLLGAAALVLLLAAAVLAGLLTVRAERRRVEIGVRLAIGASRGALVRQLVAESVVLAVPAAVLGLVTASLLTALVKSGAPADVDLPLLASTPVFAARVAATIGAAALVLSALFGLLPALRASRQELAASLKGDGRTTTGARRLSTGGAFVVFQVALAVVLLAGAGLLLRTLRRMTAIDTGFPLEGAFVADLDVARGGKSKEEGARVLAAVLERVRAIPGVTAAGLMRSVPVQTRGMKASVEMPGVAAEKGPAGGIDFDVATPGVIPAVGLRLAEGRDFTPDDDAKAAPVAIVNRAFVRRYFPGQDGLGRIIPRAAGTKDLRIVGVLEDAKMRSLREAPGPLLLVPQAQLWFAGMSLVVRTATGSARSLEPAVRAAVASVDKDLGLFAPRTLREHVGQMLGKEKLVASLLSGFAALALLLASFGLFGVLSFAAESRRREIGVRIALGAEPADILRLVTSQGARVVALGLAAGALAALAASRVLAHLLFGVSPQDPLTLAAVAFVLAASALLASAVPAWRASRVDPITALRTE